MTKRKIANSSLKKYESNPVKMTGRFIYFQKSCKILNCSTLEEYLFEYDEVFSHRLKSQIIPNYKINGIRYIHEEITLFGHIDKMNHGYIFIYHRDKPYV